MRMNELKQRTQQTGKECSQVKNKDSWRLTEEMLRREFLNFGLKLKGNPKAVGTALLRTDVTSPVICKSMGLLYNTGPNWTRG